MIVFQVLNLDPVTEILKTRCSHLYFNEDSDYSDENACENKVCRSTYRKKLNIHASAADLLHTVLE